MFDEEYLAVAKAARAKVGFLKRSPFGYFVSSILAGFFVGIGVLLAFTIGGLLKGAVYTKVVMGCAFGVALSLVVMAGAELFTGNNFVMTAGMLHREIRVRDGLLLFVVCLIGNLVGAVILALLYHLTGLGTALGVNEFFLASAETKMTMPFFDLFFRSVLCNILVCLAIWCTFRCKSESGKLTMIFWCLFAFITTGFEHSIANMSLLTYALFAGSGGAITFVNWLYNLGVCILGNMVGGILISLCYFAISRGSRQKPQVESAEVSGNLDSNVEVKTDDLKVINEEKKAEKKRKTK